MEWARRQQNCDHPFKPCYDDAGRVALHSAEHPPLVAKPGDKPYLKCFIQQGDGVQLQSVLLNRKGAITSMALNREAHESVTSSAEHFSNPMRVPQAA
eukprot:13230840-Heterocapsa_arctica.AAC.1